MKLRLLRCVVLLLSAPPGVLSKQEASSSSVSKPAEGVVGVITAAYDKFASASFGGDEPSEAASDDSIDGPEEDEVEVEVDRRYRSYDDNWGDYNGPWSSQDYRDFFGGDGSGREIDQRVACRRDPNCDNYSNDDRTYRDRPYREVYRNGHRNGHNNNDDWPYDADASDAEVADMNADRLEMEELRGADYDDDFGGRIDRRVRRRIDREDGRGRSSGRRYGRRSRRYADVISAGSWETSNLEAEARRREAEDDGSSEDRDDPDWNERDFRDYFGGDGSGRQIDRRVRRRNSNDDNNDDAPRVAAS